MNALFLAAGFGTRLKDLGQKNPKGLLAQIEGKPLLAKMINDLKIIPEITQMALISNNRFYLAYQKYLTEHFSGLPIELINDGVDEPDKRLGALGDLLFTLEKLSWWDQDLLVLPSDTYYCFLFSELIAFFQKVQTPVTVLRKIDKQTIASRLGCATVSKTLITSFIEKPSSPPSDLAAIPFYILTSAVLKRLPEYRREGNDLDAPGSLIPWLLKKAVLVNAFITTGDTLDVGTAEDLQKLKKCRC